ncbi:MAG: hypothetical protein AB7F43_03715 [Bacteriovoracia bacterium]
MNNKEFRLDPLFTIFEKHLYDFEDADLANSQVNISAFVEKVVKDYMSFLRKGKIAIPFQWEASIVEELNDHVEKMLIKKIYGCLSIKEYIQKEGANIVTKRKTARKKYNKLF